MPCANHPDAPEAARCAGCANPFCANCLVVLEGRSLCGACKAQAVRQVERGETADNAGRSPSPWEEGKSLSSLLGTVKAVLFSPKAFFGKLRLDGNGHLSFVALISWPMMILATGLKWVFGWMPSAPDALTADIQKWTLISICLLAPLGAIISTYLLGSVIHLFLMMFGGAHARLEATIRTYAYAQASSLIGWIPFLGPLVNTVWMAFALVIGLSRMHRTSVGRTLAAVLIPLGVLFATLVWSLFATAKLIHPH